jgi:nucleotide-binding universal stress UspA family protein
MRALIAYDGSKGAEQTGSLAIATPWPSRTSVRVVAVMEPSTALVPGPPISAARLVTSPEVEGQILDYLQDEVARLVERLEAAGLEAAGQVLRGRPANVLVEEAGTYEADLVLVGSRGHGPIASLVLGSVSAEVVDHAPCPVLVARGTHGKRVLLASDGSSHAARAEAIVADWPIFADAHIRVVSVAEVARPWHSGIAPTMYRQAMVAYAKDVDEAKTRHLDVARDAATRLNAAGRTVDATLRVGDAAAEIIEEASSWGADLVVLGSRGLTGLTRLVLGSVARNVLHGSTSSVLVVRDATKASVPGSDRGDFASYG